MPNTIDMGGFGESGTVLRTTLQGSARVEAPAPVGNFFDLLVAGLSKIRAAKTAILTLFGDTLSQYIEIDPEPSAQVQQIKMVAANGFNATLQQGSGYLTVLSGATNAWRVGAATMQLASGTNISWSSTTASSGTADLYLYRDGAETLNQRNGANAQTFRVTRSYTDASNYSWLTHKWNTSTAVIHAEGAGTGTDGSIAFNDAALATNATVGFLMIPSCAGVPSGTPADIPTGQSPIVYNSTDKKLAIWDGAAWVQTAALT